MQVQKNSLPIALDKKFTHDKRIIFMPTENPPDDPAGSLLFTKHGFFEIPKEKNMPSKFISKREFVMESYYKDVFSKLPLVINFHKRKSIGKWFQEARKAHYVRCRNLFKVSIWMSEASFTETISMTAKSLFSILNITGVEIKENHMYGKRHTEFTQRQTVMLNEATKVYESATHEIITVLERVTNTLQQSQKNLKEQLDHEQLTEKLETRKDEFIGIQKRKRGKAKGREVKEERMKLKEKLHEAFLIYSRLRYLSTITEMLEHNFSKISTVLCSPHKPKFELILMIKESLYLEPDLDKQKNSIISCAKNLLSTVASNRYMSKLEGFFTETLAPEFVIKETYMQFIEVALQSTGKFVKYEQVIEKEINKDIEACTRFISQYTHLEGIKMVGVTWLAQLKDKFFDVVNFYKDNYEQFNKFSLKIDEVPTTNFNSGILTIETASLRNSLQEIPKGVISSLKERLLEIITHESSELKTELFTHHALLEEKASTLPQFVEQVMSTSVLKQTKLSEWERKIGFVSECVNLCRKENVRIPANTSTTIEECKSIIKNLPAQISKAELNYQEYRTHFETQMSRGSSQLSKKIQKFQVKYIDRYLMDNERLGQAVDTLKELEKREEALSAMKQRVELYEEFNNALGCIRPSGEAAAKVQCRQEFSDMFELHCDTLKLWKLANYWKTHAENWLASTFLKLPVAKMYKKIEKLLQKMKSGTFKSRVFSLNSDRILRILRDEIEEITSMKEILVMLKDEVLKPRHWELIFKIIKKPHFMNIPFKLQDLKEANLVKFQIKIQHLYEESREESRQESSLINIKKVWDTLELVMEPYRERMNTFTLKNSQQVQYVIEEHLAIIENIEKVQYSEHIQPEIDDWRLKLNQMRKVLEYWVDAQEAWLQLEPIFSSSHMQESLPQEYESFNDIQGNFRKIMWNTFHTPKAALNLLMANRDNMLLSIMEGLSSLRKNIKGFLEARRANFPRFFFLSDPQLLEFLSNVHSREQYDKHLSALFPGAQRLYIKEINPRRFPPADLEGDTEEANMDKAPFANFTPVVNELLGPFDFSEASVLQDNMSFPSANSSFVMKQQSLEEKYPEQLEMGGLHPFEVLGMLGYNEELLFFERSVGIHEGVEGWLGEVEKQMKESLGKMVSFAVGTFPKQSLDEWVLDFPQQVIYSAVLLILTHEITELMEEAGKDNESNSGDSSEEVDNIPEDYEDHFSKVYFGSVTQSKSMGQSKVSMMKILQSKNYRGLFLRLQFWINQLIKSIQADRESKQRLVPLQLMALRSLVFFLSYQREIVGSLLDRKVYALGDFEWQKHFRIYWKADTSVTKVECGGLHMLQGNEYLGTNYRLLCTPLTSRYFLYIGCTLRESSSVLFKTNTSHQYAGDVFEEFCNWCGMGSKKITICAGMSTSSLMQVLNGAALANLWMVFEHINRLSRADLQIITKEIQMVQQQFLISDTGDSVAESSVNRSGPSGVSESSARQQKISIKSPTSLFVVLASLDPYHEVDSGLLSSLNISFRCTEMARPDYKIIALVVFVREGFRYHQGLSRMVSDFCRKLIESVDLKLAISCRDIVTVAMIAKKYRDASVLDADLELGEAQAVGKACKLYFIPKLLHTRNGFDKESCKAVYDLVDDCVASVFRKRQRGAYEQPELRKGLEQAFYGLRLTPHDYQVLAAEEIYYGLRLHRAVLVLGENSSGKSAVLSLLSTALKNLYELKVSKYSINPNVFTFKQLCGSLNSEKIQRPGILTKITDSALAETEEFNAKWLIFECEKLKSWWVDSFLPFLDQSPLVNSESYTLEPWELCLSQKTLIDSAQNIVTFPNLVHLYIPKDMQIIFETTSASSISPSIFTKLSTHYIRENFVPWESFLVPASRALSEKYIKYGLLSQWILEIFTDKIRTFIIKLHKQFKGVPTWNTKAITLSYCKILASVIENGVLPFSKPLGEGEGLYSPSTQELYDYSVKYGSTHAGLLEFRARLEICLIFSVVWTYGAILTEDDKKVFSVLFRKHFDSYKGKYFYPSDLEIFDTFIEWDTLNFTQIFTEFSEFGLTSPQPSEILVPSLYLSRAYFASKLLLIPNANYSPSLYHLHLFGPVASGKTSLARIISRSYPHMCISKVYDSSFRVNTIVKEMARKTAFKAASSDGNKKLLVLVEDIHMDSTGDVLESIRFWIKHGGFYEPKDLAFKISKDMNFVTTSKELNFPFSGHCVYLETPVSNLFKQALVNYVYLRQTPIDMLVHRFLKLITSVISNINKHFSSDSAFAFPRILQNYKIFLFFTSNCELYPEPELKEEERVAEILIYEMLRGFRDATRDKRPVEQKILELINGKLKVAKEVNDFMYGNYAQEEVAYNFLVPYTRQPSSKYRDLQDFMIEKAKKFSLQPEDASLCISSHCLHSSSLDYIWAFCRMLQVDGLHGIIDIPVGQGIYECLQLACIMRNTRLYEPNTKLYDDTHKFRQELEDSLFSVLENIRKGQTNPPGFYACAFVCITSHIKETACYDLLNSFITEDSGETKGFSKEFMEKITLLEKKKIALAAASASDEDPVRAAVKLARRYFHVIILTSSSEEFEKLNKTYPRLTENCEIFVDVAHTDFTETSNMIEKYLGYKGMDSGMADIITELFMYVRGVFERKEYYVSLDHAPIETTPIATFMCNRRLILFVDLLTNIINDRQERMKDYKQKIENMLNKSKKFQKLHSQLENNMTSLQDFSMRTSSNISSIKSQIEKIRRNQQTKNQLIEEKERLNAKLQEELDELQKDNEKVLSDKTMGLEENLSLLISHLQDPSPIIELSQKSIPIITTLLDFLLGVTGLDENFSIEEALRDSESFIDMLKSKDSSSFPSKFSEKLIEFMNKTVRTKFTHPSMLLLYDYLEALVARIQITWMLEPQLRKIDEIKSEIINNNVSITYAQKYIMDIERELKQYLDQEKRFSSELLKRKQPLKTSEITHIRTENLIAAVNDLNKRLQEKMNIAEKLEKNLLGDSYIIACNIAYLGVLNVAQRAEVRGALSNILGTNEISTDEAWQDQYLTSHKITMKRILKALKYERISTGALEELDGYEGILTYHYTNNISTFIDEHGDLQDLLLDRYCQEKTISVLCSVVNSAGILDEALLHNSQIFLEDFNEVAATCDLDGWKIGTGLTTDHPILHKLWQNNLTCTSAPTVHKDICTFSSRFPLNLSPYFWSSSIFMCVNSIGEEKALTEIKEIYLKALIPGSWDRFVKTKQEHLKAKQEYREVNLRKKLELTQMDMDSLQNYDNFIDLLEIIRVVDQANEVLSEVKEDYEKQLHENQLLNTYSYITFLLYLSLKQVGRLIGDVTYSWKNFLRTISLICSKTIRDIDLNASASANANANLNVNLNEAEAKSSPVSEDFYSRELLPAIWNVVRSGLPQENAPLLALIFSLNIGVMRETITLDNFDVFGQLFMQDSGVCTWMSSLDRMPVEGNFEETFSALEELLLTWFPDTDECLGAIKEKLTAHNFSKLEVGNVLKAVLLNSDFKQLPVFARILVAAHYPDSTLKNLLRQFIFEQLNSVFEYQEDFIKLNHFIKTASWSVPIALHSWPGMNIVNIICSLANYYGVGLEVIRTDPEIDENSKAETIETLELILKCAAEGTWVLISTTKFPSFWKKNVIGLNEMRERGQISNTFRMFIDLQGLKHYEIPDNFLHEEAVRFYMSQINAEDLEGFDDVWSNVLVENVLKNELMAEEQISSVFVENSELKGF